MKPVIIFFHLVLLCGCAGQAKICSQQLNLPINNSLKNDALIYPRVLSQDDSAINQTQLLLDLKTLASEAMEGRKPASRGSVNAQNYIASRFKQIQLQSFQPDYKHPFQYGLGDLRHGTNIIGYKPGTEQTNSFIVISAHYDHLGKSGGRIFAGADDNASGVSAMLAIAEYLQDKSTWHSIIFIATDAEEDGLFGAKAFVENPPVSLNEIKLNLNIDMISQGGSGKRLYVAGTKKHCQFKPLINRVANQTMINLKIGHEGKQHRSGASVREPDWRNASDHAPFSAKGIPYLYFGVDLHRHYHEYTDTFENIDSPFYIAATETILEILLQIDGNQG